MSVPFKRIIVLVLDSVGIGELPDAGEYGDAGSHTLGNISKQVGGLTLPHLESLGLGCIDQIAGVKKVRNPKASYGKMKEASSGKDTITGHWELMGILSKFPFPVYPNGFPSEIIQNIEKFSGRKIIGNKTASGTAIINELGKEHVQTGNLIVYTSADSVLQIAAHEEVVPLKELHETATKIRASLSPPHEVARVIIRPFLGSPGEFYRTKNRHDYSVEPPQDTVLDILTKQGVSVVAIGKINDIFSGRGVSSWQRTTSNSDGITKLRRTLSSNEKSGLVFVNLIDFDMEFGHRNNVSGYANALTEFDKELPHVISDMERDDLLIITADHGCDPTTVSTDHSREYVPILAYSKRGRKQENLGVRGSFCDVGATIVENFNIETQTPGRSFLKNI